MSKVKALDKARTEITEFVDNLIESGVNMRDALQRATNNPSLKEIALEKLSVMAIVESPKVIRAMVKKAEEGSVAAAELILDVAGALPKGKGGVNVGIQLNMNPGEKAALEADLKGDVIDV